MPGLVTDMGEKKTKENMKSKKAPSKSFTDRLAENQIAYPLPIIRTIVVAYFVGVPWAEKFVVISNERRDGRFEKSFWDFAFLFFYICVFTALRAIVMEYILIPLAVWGQVPKKKHNRFAEQSWAFIYYTLSSCAGIYVMYNSPWWFDTSYFWRDYPVTDYTKSFKYYYLVQFAYWLQQIFVLQIEAPRKDYRELVAHHINTLLLISLSYTCNFTRVGNAVFVCMDLPDAFLALSKALNYICPGIVCNSTFVCMLISWVYTRVYLYGCIIWSTFNEPEKYVTVFKLEPFDGHWFPPFVKYIIVALMLGLYILILFWTVMIFKVLYKILFEKEAKDVRSDDEDEEDQSTVTQDMPDLTKNVAQKAATHNKTS